MYDPFYNLENPEILRYEYAWVNFINNEKVDNHAIRPIILESWKRCKTANINYFMRERQPLLEYKSLSHRIEQNKTLLDTALPFMETLIDIVNESGLSVGIVDRDGFLLNYINSDKITEKTHYVFQIGENVKEQNIGTNSCGLVLKFKKPFRVVGSEHYCQMLQNNACYSSPIFDRMGELIGILNMTMCMHALNNHTLGMVVAAAKAIENELQLKDIHRQIIKNSEEQQEILETVTDGVIYINDDLIITQANMEMAQLLGMKKEEIIGKDINILNTVPKIPIIMDQLDGINRFEVKIEGRVKSFNCFLKVKYFSSNETVKRNRVLVFTKMEEIQELATKINMTNRAYFNFKDIIGNSPALRDVINLALRIASHNYRIIIEGESGTGKEMFAQAIHNNSSRANGPFIAVDCGAIPRELLESELFGYEEGSFTGARKGGQRGKFELAHQGTLFLDEIGNMPIDMQAKLLRVLQENYIMRIGGSKPISIDVQVIAATNSDLSKEVAKGSFREDLFYRLNVIYLKLPSLRERKEDIPILIYHYINKEKVNLNRNIKINDTAMKVLMNYDWPGNVRQLHNVIERMIIMSEQNVLGIESIPKEITEFESDTKNFLPIEIEPLEKATAKYIKSVLDQSDGNIKRASEILQISRTTIYRNLNKYDLL
ncbi:MAG: sigma 54-interacting transcriptional regulator [Clostridia bacterium]|nr:sigma 54-interacting transcriptional regulator [Clostridia bacterium]